MGPRRPASRPASRLAGQPAGGPVGPRGPDLSPFWGPTPYKTLQKRRSSGPKGGPKRDLWEAGADLATAHV